MAATAKGESRGGTTHSHPPRWTHRRFVAEADMREFDAALRTDTVTFHEVARAWFGLQCHEDAEGQAAYQDMYHKLMTNFGQRHGGVVSSYFCEHLPIAVALTDIDAARERGGRADSEQEQSESNSRSSVSALHVEPLFGHPADPEAKRILAHCLDLDYRSLEFLPPVLRDICVRRIFAIIAALFGMLDERASRLSTGHQREAARIALSDHEVIELNRQLHQVEHEYRLNVKQRAEWHYFVGMVLAAAPVVIAYVVLSLIGLVPAEDAFAVSIVAGAIGAVVSVMQRISQDKLTLIPESAKENLWLLGSIRPLIGAVFGALTYVVIESGLLTGGTAGAIPSNHYLYYAGLAFAAGFTERVAHVFSPPAAPDDTPRARAPGSSQSAPDPPEHREGNDELLVPKDWSELSPQDKPPAGT